MANTKSFFKLPLVNAHTHAAMVYFRGMAEDVSLNNWLNKYIWPAERKKVKPNFIYEQTKIAISEMQRNGIRVFNNMYFFEEETARAAEEMKMQTVIGEGMLDFPTPSAGSFEEAMEITEKLLTVYHNNSYISVAVAPHSIYTVNDNNLIKAKKLAKKYGAIYHIHLAETKREFDECLEKNKVTPVEYLEKLGILDEKTVLAHCVWVTDKDIEIIARYEAKVVHCPLSNLKLGSGISPVSQMLEKGITVSLGTDGAASSNRMDIWEAGKIAALLQKGINHDPTKLPVKKVIEMMTVNGLKTLGIKKINGKSIIEIQQEIDKANDFNFLYEKNVSELEFNNC